MGNKETFQEKNNRLNTNNIDLNTILTTINNLPEAGSDVKLQEKSVVPTTSNQNVVADSGYTGLSRVAVGAVTSSIDSNIQSSNIKKGVTILDVTGTLEAYVEANLQEKTVTPTTSSQSIIADSSFDGLSKVTVNAVTSAIDSDIKASNIKKGVTILDVTGTLEEGITPSGTIEITENGTHNVTNYASAEVNIPSEDLSTPLNTQGSIITSQESKIATIISSLAGKAAGGGNTDIEDGMVMRTLSGAYVNNRVTIIGQEGLRCTKITSLHCENVTRTDGESVRQCSELETVYLPKCTSLGSYSFGICAKLSRVELGQATTISAYSFYQCPNLTTLIIRTTSQVCSLGAVNALTSSGIANGTGYIYVPDDLVDDYKAATNWSTYAAQIKGLSELEG